MKTKIRYQDDSDGRGWVAWVSNSRGWQPIVGCDDLDTVPDFWDVLACVDVDVCDEVEVVS